MSDWRFAFADWWFCVRRGLRVLFARKISFGWDGACEVPNLVDAFVPGEREPIAVRVQAYEWHFRRPIRLGSETDFCYLRCQPYVSEVLEIRWVSLQYSNRR